MNNSNYYNFRAVIKKLNIKKPTNFAPVGVNNNNNTNNNFTICYPGCLSTRRRHSQIRKEDHGRSIFTCPAHTINVRQDKIPSAVKWENVRIDQLRLPTEDRTSGLCFPVLGSVQHRRPIHQSKSGTFWHGSVFVTTRP